MVAVLRMAEDTAVRKGYGQGEEGSAEIIKDDISRREQGRMYIAESVISNVN